MLICMNVCVSTCCAMHIENHSHTCHYDSSYQRNALLHCIRKGHVHNVMQGTAELQETVPILIEKKFEL